MENNVEGASLHSSGLTKKSVGRSALRIVLLALLSLLLAACNISGLPTPPPSGQQPITSSSLPAVSPTASSGNSLVEPTATSIPPSNPTAVAPLLTATALPAATAPAGAPTVPAAAAEAIKSVIEKGNHEEEQAFASGDPSLMADTSTADYYQQMVQAFNDMSSSGVTGVKLLKLEWGPITLQDANTAHANTTETWSTSFSDGSNLQETDPNVYTLLKQNGAWKVQDDQHPNTRTLQPQPGAGTPGTAPTSVAPSAPGPVASAVPGGSSVEQSSNWAGYAATGGTFTVVSATWTIPNVSAGSGQAVASDATWVGIGGANTTDLIQAGTQAIIQNGQVAYTAWWETLPQAAQTIPMDVSAGDSVSVSIARQQDGTWQIDIHDATSGQSFKKNLTYRSTLSSAEWIEESPTAGRRALIPLDNFGTVTFTNATTVEDGQQRTIKEAGGQPISMYSSAGGRPGRFGRQNGQPSQPLAQPSALGPDGASFSVTRTNAAAPSNVP